MFIHLDTSFLSQFAKAEMGKLKASSYAQKWRELLERLRQEVRRGTLICPASEFPIEEVLLAPDIVSHFIRVQSELSRDYFFNVWTDILIHQTANEVLTYLGRPHDIDLSWRAFTKQPPGIVPPWATKIAKENVRQFHEELRRQGAPKRSYAEQYKAERRSLLQESFLQPLRQLLGFDTFRKSPDPVEELLHTGFFGMLIREANISDKEFSKVLDFFETDLVDRIPYIHIYCSINASLRINEPARKSRSGDFHDLPALACAMPYCAIVTTDANMKAHVVNRLHLDEKYGTRIFSASAKDLDAFLRELSSITH